MIQQLVPAYGWTALLAVRTHWPRWVKLERWPVVAWALENINDYQEVVAYVATENGECNAATSYANFVGILGPGDRIQRKHREWAKKVAV